MREVTREEYLAFKAKHPYVVVEGKRVRLIDAGKIHLLEPPEFRLETTTVWSFENRGKWATHRGDYRGNWAPEIPRNLILRYTQPGDTVLDQMVGSGTTLVECKLLGRNGIGVDINYEALMVAWNRLDFTFPSGEGCSSQRLYLGDARDLNLIEDASIDLIATHPPYANIIRYSKAGLTDGDLSQARSLDDYLEGMRRVALESYRVLKPGHHCAILVGDTHRHKHYVPIAFRVMQLFLDAGFILREDVIKLQWHVQTERQRWNPRWRHDFLLTFHEHLFIFRKPSLGEDVRKYRNSMKWW
jgi:DNA modification methylase